MVSLSTSRKIFVSTALIVALFSCGNPSPDTLGDAAPETMTRENTTSGLRTVVSSIGENSGYIKRDAKTRRTFIYPSAWDRFPDAQGSDPTLRETGFLSPEADYVSVTLDAVNFMGSDLKQAFVHYVLNESRQSAYVYSLENGEPKLVLTTNVTGEISPAGAVAKPMIVTDEKNPAGETVRSEYLYDSQKNTFTKTQSIAPQAPVSARAGPGSFLSLPTREAEEFIRGPWVREINEIGGQEDFKNPTIATFLPGSREIMFGSNDSVELFNWVRSSKAFGGLVLECTNMQIGHISNNIRIELINADRMAVKFQGDEAWAGSYRRMTMQEKIASIPTQNSIVLTDSLFSGLFRTADKKEYFFGYPEISITDDKGIQETGLYALFRVGGEKILEIKLVDERGFTKFRAIYSISYEERKEGSRVVRALTLAPGSLAVWGFESQSGIGTIHLEQVEIS